jgi:hypothetical protein
MVTVFYLEDNRRQPLVHRRVALAKFCAVAEFR